jgi:hypothetical protein
MENSDSVFSLVYLSVAVIPFSEQDLSTLLAKSRAANSKLEVTGMLLFKDQNFLQVLEGEEENVLHLYQKIAKDARHTNPTVLFRDRSNQREFPDWSMGFYDLRSAATPSIPGFSNFLDTPLTSANFAATPHRAKTLLLLFKEENMLRAGTF